MKNSKEIIQLKDDREREVRRKLVDFAAAKRTISYQSLSNITDLGLKMRNEKDVEEISRILDNISRFELQENRPLLSAIVIKANQNIQGGGFFKLCEEKEEDLKKFLGCQEFSPSINERQEFSEARINDCYDFWSKRMNFKRNKDKDTHKE